MTNSTRCTLLAKQACTTFSHVVQKITPPSANNFFKLFFALFATLTLNVGNAWGEETLVKVSSTDLVDGDYLITATKSGSEYYLTATTFATKKSSAAKLESDYSNLWSFTKQSDGTWSVKLSSGEGLGITADNNGVVCSKTGGKPFTISATASGETTVYMVASDGTNNRYLTLYQTSNWRCYKTTTNATADQVRAIQLYKVTSSGSSEEPVLSSIAISGDLTNKTYEEGDELDLTGLTVQANYESGDPKDVTNDVEWSYEPLTAGQTSVTVTATYEDKTETKTINGLTVNEHIVTPGAYDITLNNVFFGTTASTNITGPVTGKKDDITITINGTGSTKPRTDAAYTRFYASSTMAISVPSGYVIKSIAITKNESDYAAPSVNVGTFNTSTKTWTGTANSVTMSFSAKSFINSIKVTYVADVKYALNITTPSNGTLVVKDGENVLTSGAEIYEGTKLTVIATPETGYEEGDVVVKNASDEYVTADVYEAGTLTMPAYAVTISATFEKKPCTLLNTPVVTATPTYNSATLTWAAVANAAKYSVKVGETTTEVTEPTYTATGLNAETTYTYQVQAIAKADQDTDCDSEVAEGTFTTATPPTATLTLKDIVGTTTQTGALNSTITLPTTAAECSKTFVGWDADENCNHAPTYALGAEYTFTAENQTLYAVYADGEAGEALQWTIKNDDLKVLDSSQSSGYAKYAGDQEKDGVTFNITSVMPATGENNGKIQMQAEKATIYNKTAMPGNIISIAIDGVDLSVYEGTEVISSTPSSGAITKNSEVYNFSSGKRYFHLKKSTKSAGYANSITVTYASAPTYSNYSTKCAAAPKAEVNPTAVTATAAGGNGKVEVTYENVNTEDLRVALFNDEECGVVFTAGWLTASIDADKNIAYTVAENTTYTERKAYIKLTAPETTGAVDPAVVVIPVTQAAKDKVFASLAELLANITPTTDATQVTVTLTKEPIVDIYVSGNYRNGIFLNVPYQETTKKIEIYSRNVPAEWVVGGSVSGTLTNCDWKDYNGTWELCPADWSELTYQEPKAVSTVVVSGTPTKTTYVDGEAFDPAGLTVTVNYNDATTEVNPTGVTFTVTPATLVKGQTSVSVTATYNSITSVAYEVTGLTVNDIPTKTVAEFITAEGGRCYLEGIVSNITNTTYGNFDLTDASGTIYVYGCLNAAGEKQKFAALGVKNGDKIKVIADQFKVYSGKDQATDVQYVSHISAATITIADITMEVGKTKTIAATITPADASVTYAIKAGSENYITLNGAEITATAAGTATIVATIAETADYLGATKEFTVTVTAVDTRKKAVSPSPFTAVSGDLNPNDITYASYQGGASTAPGIYNNGIRLYQISGTNTYGGYITLTAVKGCMIDQVEITTTDQYETTTVAYSVDDNVTLLGSASVAQLGKYSTPAGLNTESVNILNLGTTNKNRLEIASIIVYYTGQPLADPELSWTSNAVELRVGEAFTAPALNNPNNVTGITYDSDNESLAKVNESTGAVTLVPDATGTAIITATFAGDNTYKAVEASYAITVKPALVSGVWELVTDDTSLAAGDKVVIVAKESDYALSTTQNSNNRGQAEVTKNNDNTVAFSNDVQVLTLEAGSVKNTFALNTGTGYLYAASSSSNHLKTQDGPSINANWTITINNNITNIIAQGEYTHNWIQYNKSSSLFSCYDYDSKQQAICLYRKKNVKVEGKTDNTSIPNQSDVTVDNAELTVTTEAEYDNMYIGGNGTVKVVNEVTVNNLYISTTMGAIGATTSGQLSTTQENLNVTGDVFIDITLGKNDEGKNGDPNQWHAFTVPFPVDAMNGVYDIDDNKLTNEVNYAIMDYHGDLRANGQYGWKKYRGILVPGTFYLMTVDGERDTYRFKKVEDAAIVAPATKAITAYTGSGDATKDKGWNGVGNPTLMHGKVGYKALILNPASYTYEAYEAEEVAFTVGTPFFIQAAENGTMTIAAETSASLAPARRAAAAVENIKVMLGNSDYTDRLYVSASEDAINEYEIGKDLGKMAMTSTPSVVQISALAYDTRLCMIDAPMANNEALVALNLYAPANGEYTLSIEAQDNEKVYLLHDGTFVWDLSMSEYPITLNKGDNAGYSILVHRADAPTSVETIDGANNQSEKLIHNGNLYILHNGKVFDAVGSMLK